VSDWHVIVVEGSAHDLRVCVGAFVAERRPDPPTVVLGDDVGLERASLVERLRALVHGGHHAVLVAGDATAPLEAALGGAGLRVVDRHPVARASFRFSADAFSRDVSTSIRGAFAPLPPGVHFEQHSEHEAEHREHKGVELYASVHEYTYRVEGTLAGPLPGVLEVRRRLAEIEMVEIAPLRLA
jgi:hypothetical protein